MYQHIAVKEMNQRERITRERKYCITVLSFQTRGVRQLFTNIPSSVYIKCLENTNKKPEKHIQEQCHH